MTSHNQPQSLFWVTCKITTDCGTLEFMATDEHDACEQARALYNRNPKLFHHEISAKTSFEAEYAPLEEEGA
ncbi:hypothetical protein LRX75_22595 [Rhizobium sp. DKSPLA3]|uniref:Uncharacterized protein n=1 Tax=Rhizobium quercicola TaxID=2901226 RepID=A0A9X1T3C7_9HYPH|nr:hypothetical protein [Rhizobium quercicola]MCD7111820.1 hypothetical protein [Rhizobium quercicola]